MRGPFFPVHSCGGCGRPSRRGLCDRCRREREARRSALRGASGYERQRLVEMVLARDEHRCVQCSAPCPHPRHWQVDHEVPIEAPGGEALARDPANLRTLCDDCHNRRRRRQPW